MFSLLRAAARVPKLGLGSAAGNALRRPAVARSVGQQIVARSGMQFGRGKRIPFIPAYWMGRYRPKFLEYYLKDKVFAAYLMMILYTLNGAFTIFYLQYPYRGDHYNYLWHSPMYKWYLNSLENSGELAENLRIKRTKFYLESEMEETTDGRSPSDYRWDGRSGVGNKNDRGFPMNYFSIWSKQHPSGQWSIGQAWERDAEDPWARADGATGGPSDAGADSEIHYYTGPHEWWTPPEDGDDD